MQDTIYWLVALIVALGGIGTSMYFQGKLLLEPKKKERIGKLLLSLGIVYLGLTVIAIIAWFILWKFS